MGEIATSVRQITFYYNSNSIRAKKAFAYIQAQGLPILEIDILKTKLTGTQIAEIADKLHMEIKDLVNLEHPSYHSECRYHNFSDNDWIKMIQHNPQILKQPIVIKGDKIILVETPSDVNKI
ncbi:arsenate reductase family protein [Lutibacter sp.]|uniref:arsenate reductase family protein n=1 Tax=Lutibacter sp. TaxID=1925666 RepID=UPI0035621D95